MNKIACIYKICCLNSNKFYIGSSVDLKKRWSKHKSLLRNNKHPNKKLQNLVNKYGVDTLYITVLELIQDISAIRDRELHFITELSPVLNIAKLAVGGDTLSDNPNKITICEKISKSGKSRYKNMTSERREELRINNHVGKNNPRYGSKWSEDMYKQFSKSFRIENTEYRCLSEASRTLGIPVPTIHYRLKSNSIKYSMYQYL